MGKLTKQSVTDKAKYAQVLLGDGWEISVKEHPLLGWSWSLLKGVMELTSNDRDGEDLIYTVFFNTNPQIVVDDKNPVKAVQKAIAEAKAIINTIQADIKKVKQ